MPVFSVMLKTRIMRVFILLATGNFDEFIEIGFDINHLSVTSSPNFEIAVFAVHYATLYEPAQGGTDGVFADVEANRQLAPIQLITIVFESPYQFQVIS